MNKNEQDDFSPVLKLVGKLMGTNYAFISNKGIVDTGEILDVVITRGGVTKVKIKGEIMATVTPDKLFSKAVDAYKAAIEIAEKEVQNIKNDISAMQGRIKNLVIEEEKEAAGL